uniref:Uncharacterized protein n=1 Tax=Setaria italica TaxID=4555 RepID=K3ZPR5_SETIT
MITVPALERMAGSVNVSLFRIAVESLDSSFLLMMIRLSVFVDTT